MSSGQKGTINIPRQGRVSLIAESGPPAIYCCHGNRYSELMSHIMEKITGRFMLVDDKLEHSFITQKCKDAFAEAVVAACMKCLQGNNSVFKWYVEWELVRTDMGDGVSHDGVWVLAASSAHSLQASTEQCVHAVLDNAMRKFKRTPPWAEIQVIVLETSPITPANLAAIAIKSFQSLDDKLITHFLIVEDDDIKEASAIVIASERETEAERQRQETHVLKSPVSEARVQAFEDDYLKGRKAIGAVEKIFRYYGLFQHKAIPNHLTSFGFNQVVNKGPFVDSSNWSDLKGWGFAVAEENHLLKELHTHLADSVNLSHQTLPDAISKKPQEILNTAKKMADLLSIQDQCLIVIASHLDVGTVVSLDKMLTTPEWELGDELRTNWILGKHEGRLILHLNDRALDSLYVVDVPKFASLVQYDPIVDLKVLAIDEVTAKQMLKDNPELNLDANSLLSMVRLILYQSYEIQIRDRKAVWAAKFSG